MLKTTFLKIKAEYLIRVVRFMYVLKKKLFNSLVAKKEGTVKMVEGSACEVIGTGTIKVKERDETVHTLEAVRYVPEASYNLISVGVLEKKE